MKLNKSESSEKFRIKPVVLNSYISSANLEKNMNDFDKVFRGKMLMTTSPPSVLRSGERIKFDTTSKTEPNEPLATTDRDVKDFASIANNTQSSFNKSKENEYYMKQQGSAVRPSTELRTRPGDSSSKDVMKEKELEIEMLRGRVHDLQREIHSKTVLQKSFFEPDVNPLNFPELDREDVEKQKLILASMIKKTYDIYKVLSERCSTLTRLISQLEFGTIEGITEGEFLKVKATLDDLAFTLSTASRTEVEYGIKLRDNEKKQLELAKVKAENTKYVDFLKKQGEELTYVKKLRHDLQHKLEESDKALEHVRFKNQEYEKKIEKLEKRIELILETDIGSDKDHMRKAITELVKENEKFKRQSFVQEKELKKNRDEMNKVRGKVMRQNKKIENLLKKKGAPAASDDLEKNLFNKNPTEDHNINILQSNSLPVTLDFRHSSLKVQYAELLNDIMEQGGSVFLDLFKNLKDEREKNESLILLTNQLVSNREFSERLHFFLRMSLELLKIKDVKEAMVFLHKYFKHTFSSENLNLWVPDGASGIFYTYNASRQEVRCISTRGLIHEVITSRKAFNKRNMKNTIMCDLTNTKGKYTVDNALVVPVKNSFDQIIGILEISNIFDSHFGYDDEYFGIALAHLVSIVLNRINQEKAVLYTNKIRQMNLEALIDFCQSVSIEEICKKASDWAFKIFGSYNSRMMFIENQQFIVIDHEKQQTKKFDCTMGLAGQSYTTQKSIVMSDVVSAKEYNQLVDIHSNMPVYFGPVIVRPGQETSKIVGVFQIVVKSKSHTMETHERYDDVLEAISMEEPLENQLKIFSEFIGVAYEVISMKARKN